MTPPADPQPFEQHRWAVIPCAPDYEISEYGMVRRLTQPASNGSRVGKVMSTYLKHAYLRCGLFVDGKTKHFLVHRLVAIAYLGPPPFPKAEAAHLDGNPQNNHYSNLMWASHTTNMSHKVNHGTDIRGSKHPHVKLTVQQVKDIRIAHSRGAGSCADLARRHKINYATVWCLLNGRSWKHIA
jgi:hypothetical protein